MIDVSKENKCDKKASNGNSQNSKLKGIILAISRHIKVFSWRMAICWSNKGMDRLSEHFETELEAILQWLS